MPAKKKNQCGFDGATLARCKATVGEGPPSKRRPGGVLKHCSASGGGLRTCPKEGMGGPTDRLLRLYWWSFSELSQQIPQHTQRKVYPNKVDLNWIN